ncbi:hypothetical protein AJ80_00876 [Polytolypa hystricis UAMH7299]|uniref:Uncharacterized protein n=1 Tax=Polytolypa hystricis (strain UAMH7299) TaxID=1447883 RepID=A0A2B7Z2Q0_POLH7|nr:hypothetical protein AJ80_00876 [Polytolypa hystricis UAMH7299]
MASASFRDSMNSLGWTRTNTETRPATTGSSSNSVLSKLQSLNPFADGGYVQLPAQEASAAPLPAPTRREEEEGWFACESPDILQDTSLFAYDHCVVYDAGDVLSVPAS